MKTNARDRTVSPRKRAGSRRNKKQKNVPTFNKDRHKIGFTISHLGFWPLNEGV